MALHTIDQTLKAGAPGGAFMDAAGRPPTFYHACPVDWTVHIRGEDGATISGLTDDYVSAVLKLSEAVTSAEPLRTLTVAAGNDPVFALSADDATLVAEGAEARDLWAVVYLLNASGVQVPVGCGKVRCQLSGAQAAGEPSDPGSAALTAWLLFAFDATRYPNPFFMLFSGGLILGAVYMATDMATSPVTPKVPFSRWRPARPAICASSCG